MDVRKLLTFVVEVRASDVHLTVANRHSSSSMAGSKSLIIPILSRDEIHNVVYGIMGDGKRKTYEKNMELDFSFDLGEPGRFHADMFIKPHGEGTVFPTIPTRCFSVEYLGLPSILTTLCEREKDWF